MDLISCFKEYTNNWVEKINNDEWYFSKKREQITATLSQSEAFELIPQAVSLILLQTDENLCSEAFDILMTLVRISNTTEMNEVLSIKWEKLIAHLSQFGDYQKNQIYELKKWYRKE